MPNISTGLVSKYHYSGDVALKRNFNKPEKESIIYNSLGFVIPAYKYTWMTKCTIEAEEVKKNYYPRICKYISTYTAQMQ